MKQSRSALAIFAAALSWSCGSTGDSLAFERSEVVYAADDRLEYFETVDPGLCETWANAIVALIPKINLHPATPGIASSVPTVGTTYRLCEGERFSAQPSAAFCSGVLVGADLVLTAGHCAHAFALDEFAAVFGYYAVDSERLALAAGDIVDVSEVVSERLDRAGDVPRLDYAWLRPGRVPGGNRRPAPIASVASVTREIRSSPLPPPRGPRPRWTWGGE